MSAAAPRAIPVRHRCVLPAPHLYKIGESFRCPCGQRWRMKESTYRKRLRFVMVAK